MAMLEFRCLWVRRIGLRLVVAELLHRSVPNNRPLAANRNEFLIGDLKMPDAKTIIDGKAQLAKIGYKSPFVASISNG